MPDMPEVELAPEGRDSDPAGKRVGIQAAILAVFLAVVTIASHRAHTTAVIVRTEANDQWSFYQSKRMTELEGNEAAIRSRLGTIEDRLMEVEKRLNIPPSL